MFILLAVMGTVGLFLMILIYGCLEQILRGVTAILESVEDPDLKAGLSEDPSPEEIAAMWPHERERLGVRHPGGPGAA